MYWSPFGKALVALLSQQVDFELAENYIRYPTTREI